MKIGKTRKGHRMIFKREKIISVKEEDPHTLLIELLYDMGQVIFQSSRKIINRTISGREIEEKSREFMKGKCIAFK